MRLDLLIHSLVWEAYFDGVIKLFEPGVNRNFVSIHDVVECFLQARDEQCRLRGNLYNLGNDEINMTKGDLVDRIRKIVPCSLVECDKCDPDRRNYLVSSAKLKRDMNFEAKTSLESGIKELVDYYNKLPSDRVLRDKVIVPMRNA